MEKIRFRNFIVQPEKMRFIKYLLYLLGKKLKETERPLIEIACEIRINTTYDKETSMASKIVWLTHPNFHLGFDSLIMPSLSCL